MENRRNKVWTIEEDMKLENLWGKYAVETIAETMGRTKSSILHRVNTLELGGFFDNGLYTATDVSKILGVCKSQVIYWIAHKGLKATRKRKCSQMNYQIQPHNLVEWLKENQNLWCANKVENMALGKEEQWLLNKREKDKNKIEKNKRNKYTLKEDELIKKLYLEGYSNKEICERTGRSLEGIKNRLVYLREKYNLPFRNAKTNAKRKKK